MPHWVINTNGDAPETFRDSYAKVARLARELRSALDDVYAGPLHGRNYQTLADPAGARLADAAAILKQAEALDGIRTWATEGRSRYLAQRGGHDDG